eukprot:CAMPEP_0197902950 /NCGR_PEP_ID=MMETSP1439-20131203/54751_1 /TAXON_ID=66791 /ORGANISM="Gonyaulax spinifera, Strain CCMP409" /LENGTH=146 /DNA_ID=CAMNT_0043524031 /DNA_START=86 /DNA_END=523 /DNA_ORIENTATION=+
MAAAEEAYTWTQNFGEVYVKVRVPTDLTKAGVEFKVQPRHLRLTIAKEVVLDGELTKDVDPEESTWTLETEDGVRYVLVTMTKVNKTALKSNREWPCLWSKDVGSVAQQIVNETTGAVRAADRGCAVRDRAACAELHGNERVIIRP